jgi:hypothetical protein
MVIDYRQLRFFNAPGPRRADRPLRRHVARWAR